MGAGVVGIGKLVEHAALALALHFFSQIARVFHAARARGEDEFRAISLHGLRALHGKVFRHDEHHAVAHDGRRHGQCNTGVAAGGFNQRVAGAHLAARLRALNHGQCRAVFHRTGRVVAFQLAENDVAPLPAAGHARQAHQRRAANDVLYGGVLNFLGRLLAHGVNIRRAAASGCCAIICRFPPPGWRNW